MYMNFDDRLTLTIVGAILGFILAYSLWWLKELRVLSRRKTNLIRIIYADIKATLKTLEVINDYDIYFNKLKESDPDPLLIFNASRMSNFFLDFKEDIYLIPPVFTEELLNYYDAVNACTLLCSTFKEDDFKAISFERRKAAYLRWVYRLKDANTKGDALSKLLKLRLK